MKFSLCEFNKMLVKLLLRNVCRELLVRCGRALFFFFVLIYELPFAIGENPRLILMSLDGCRWDYLDRQVKLPNLRYVVENGVVARKGMKNTFITKTIPNHWTLLTGLHAENHGMVANDFFDPVLKKSYHSRNFSKPDQAWYDYTTEPIWATNQVQNPKHRSGIADWPDYTPEVKGVRPFRLADRDYKKRTSRQSIDLLVEWFTSSSPINFGIMYKRDLDQIGHHNGPFSPELDATLEEVDTDVGYLLQKLRERDLFASINIIITSDHGMTSLRNKIDLDEFIDPKAYTVYTDNPVADIHPKSKDYFVWSISHKANEQCFGKYMGTWVLQCMGNVTPHCSVLELLAFGVFLNMLDK